KPKDVKVLSNDSVVEGSQVTLRCESAGNPPADTYQWKKVCSGTEMRLEGSTRELRIQVSIEDESCDYYCRAGNVIGGQDSEPKRFHIQSQGRLSKASVISTALKGALFLFTSVALICFLKNRRNTRKPAEKAERPVSEHLYEMVSMSRGGVKVEESMKAAQ
ncbi:CXADR-like membrane protein, partial [Hypanus sabinus]|uniref:CXADR-like membrane protein n=1 Tax=Hypanus sabinus TaxID=79690 RepID=UPI0028C41B41